ncbi:MAG TPA: response regulator [Synechococcus sp. M44_DOE_062]|nr:response regulator [Synechococcus sp. M44_DOE_062]
MGPNPTSLDPREWQVRLQFLDEAQAYLDTLETGVLGLGSQSLDRPRLDCLLRAAHSIKGGAAMMGFPVLSDLAHRLEDGFKILQVAPHKADPAVERSLLAALDCMRQIAQQHRQQRLLDESWLAERVQPLFNQLREQLGELQPEDNVQVLAAEAGGDMRVLLFETEVEACLQRLEGVLAHPEQPCLREEFLIAAQELGALGEMLDLPAFATLCGSVVQALEALPPNAKEQVLPVAQAALQAWRRSQALVLVGQVALLPSSWDPAEPPVSPPSEAPPPAMTGTASVTRVLLTECQGLMLAFPANAVEELLIPPELSADSFLWEGEQIPLIPVGRWFRFARWQPRREIDETPLLNRPVVLLVVEDNQPYGLLVDRFWREQEVTLRPVEGGLPLPPGFSGCTVLANGQIALFVDPPALLSWLLAQRDQPCQSARDPLPQPRLATQPTLLVVEDSVNVRRFLAMTLERAGFRVEQARDGQEALEHLQRGIPIRAVITDIEMPRLDGFGLLAQIRAHPLYDQLPVVMLTSRSGEKHRQLAQRLGASAYLSKPFQEQELIQKLRQLLQPASSVPSTGVLTAR